jgi:hypothetical protein
MKYNYTIYEELYKSQWITYATLQIQNFALLSLPTFTAQSSFWELGNYSGCKKKVLHLKNPKVHWILSWVT